jgi:hypothetical protein
MKLVSKTRQGVRVHKVYDTAKTPYQRLLESAMLTEAKQTELAAIYHGINPAYLLGQLNLHLEKLWKLADRAMPKAETIVHSVTANSEAMTTVR